MRLKTGIWVAAYLRRCQIEGAAAVLRRRGAEEAGAIFIKVSRLDGHADLYGPAPQSAFDEARPSERAFSPALKNLPLPEACLALGSLPVVPCEPMLREADGHHLRAD